MISWIKLDINILDDAKIKIIRSHPNGDSVVLLWIGLLCLAMKSSRPGTIEISDGLPYTVDDLSNLFNIEKKTVEMGLALFVKYRMIETFDGGSIDVINFSKHQKIDEIERKRELTRARVEKYRDKSRQCNALLTHDSVTVTLTDKDLDLDKDKEKREGKKPSKFSPPSIQEITEYCEERNNEVDPVRFFNFYAAKNWMIGKNKMQEWKAAVITWERREKSEDRKEACER